MLFATIASTLLVASSPAPLVVAGDTYLAHAHPSRALGDGPVVANLEGAFCEDAAAPSESDGRYRLCLGRTTARTLRALGVVAVSVENNHRDDAGVEGGETARRLGAAGVASVRDGEARCVRDGLCVLAWHDARSIDATLRALKRAPPAVRHVVIAHRSSMGGAAFKEALRALADAGAEVVIGMGSHRIGGVERRRGRTIFYDVGDLVMDCRCSASDYGLVVHVPAAGEPWAQVVKVAHFPDDEVGALASPAASVEVARRIAEASPRDGGAPVLVDGELHFVAGGAR